MNAAAAEDRLLELLRGLDFARRWFDLCAATRVGPPRRDLPAADRGAALAALGRAFREHKRENFFAVREADAPGELGVNLSLRHGTAEFVLVARAPAGHVGGPFSALMRDAERRFGPPLPAAPPYPQPWYQHAASLRRTLAAGFALYDEVAAAVLADGLLTDAARDPAA